MTALAPSTRSSLLAASDSAAIIAFVSVGLVSHRGGISAGGYASDALPILGAWFAAGAFFGTYTRGGLRPLLATWAVAVPAGVLIRALVLDRPLNVDQLEFLVVALVFSLVFVLGFRVLVSRVGA